jgi:hypothetical protein
MEYAPALTDPGHADFNRGRPRRASCPPLRLNYVLSLKKAQFAPGTRVYSAHNRSLAIRRRPAKSPVLTFFATGYAHYLCEFEVVRTAASHALLTPKCAMAGPLAKNKIAGDGRDAVVRGIQRNSRPAPRCSIVVKPPPRVVPVLIAHNLSLSQPAGLGCNVKPIEGNPRGPRQIERPMARGAGTRIRN